MSAFDTAIATLFADANMAVAVTYTPVSGSPSTVRAIRSAPDVVRDYMDARLHTASVIYEVRIADVPAPEAGDTITDAGEDRIVQGEPRRDDHRLTWVLDTQA